MFKTDVGSILNWDEIDMRETSFSVSRDIILKNRQLVLKGVYETGKGTTIRTSDDDIFNQDHLISHGKGSVDLKTYSFSAGMRNLWHISGWDITPYIGYKKRKQNYIMFDHVEPHPFTLEKGCKGIADWEGYKDVCTGGISSDDHGLGSGAFYKARENSNGERERTNEEVTDTNIPGMATLSNGEKYVNFGYGDRIEDSDFCYHTDGQDPTEWTCLERGEGGSNLLMAFGGVSQIHERPGITHMYFVDWTGPFIAASMERKIDTNQQVYIYAEYFKPSYKVWGNWPNRTDWRHDPSFIDSGGSGYGILFNFNYKYEFRPNTLFTVGVEYEYLQNKNADTLLFLAEGGSSFLPKSVEFSQYYGYGLNIGIKTRW